MAVDIVAVLKEIPAIIVALGALVVSVRSSVSTRRRVREMDQRLEGCEAVNADTRTHADDASIYHERLMIAHLRKALRVPDDMPDASRARNVTTPPRSHPPPPRPR